MVQEIGDVIINARKLLTRRARRRDRLLTMVLWGLYVYLWLPLISLAAWFFGLRFAYTLVERAGGPESLLNLLYWFGVFLLVISATIIGWSALQRARFAGNERRTSTPTLSAEDELSFWQISQAELDLLRNENQLLVEFDEQAQLSRVQLRKSPEPSHQQTDPAACV